VQYLASFEIAEAAVLQGIVHFGSEPRGLAFYPEKWFSECFKLIDARHGLTGCEVSLRSHLQAGKLSQTLFFRLPVSGTIPFRRFLGSFLVLNTIVDDSVTLPRCREEHDRIAAAIPRRQCVIRSGAFSVNATWLACAFRAHGILFRLLNEARSQERSLFHQINLQSFVLSPQLERQARKNLLGIRELRGANRAMLASQEKLFDYLSGPQVLADEYLAVETVDDAAWLSGRLKECFSETWSALKFAAPDFPFEDSAYNELLSVGLHNSILCEPSISEIYSSLLDPAEIRSLFRWGESLEPWFNGSDLALRQIHASQFRRQESLATELAEDNAAANASAAEIPLTHSPDGYIFVSYKHADYPRIVPILEQLVRWGHEVWFDKGIPGASEWNAEIEERVARCRLLMLFVSQASVDSKYVRREVLYADTLQKPILSIILEEAILRRGMDMLLRMYQMVSAEAGDFSEQLEKALHYVRIL